MKIILQESLSRIAFDNDELEEIKALSYKTSHLKFKKICSFEEQHTQNGKFNTVALSDIYLFVYLSKEEVERQIYQQVYANKLKDFIND